MWFNQSPYECRAEWGRRGAREAADRGDIVIIVDVLSFSSTVISALSNGTIIYPFPSNLDGKEYAEKIGAEYLLGRAEAARLGLPSLSPVSFKEHYHKKKFVLSSLNGAFCTWVASKVPALLIGSLLNAAAVASAANQLRKQTRASITIVPCGEQWSDVQNNEDTLRPAIEDYLSAGAIINYLEGKKSPEAEVCMGAFQHARPKISKLIWECGSGRELRGRGFEDDVIHCSRLNAYQTVPILNNDHFIDFKEWGELNVYT